MLVLTRKQGESIFIGEEIRLTVLEVKGDQIRLGIEAPRKVPVHRGEVYEAIQRANQEAAASPSTGQALEEFFAQIGEGIKK